MNRRHSLRGRLLVVMTAIFTLGVLAAWISYRLEVNGIVRNIHERTLQAQASAIVRAMARRPDGSVEVKLPSDWRKAYSDSSRLYFYTIYDARGRALAWSPNLAMPLGDIPIAPAHSAAPIRFVGIGRDARAMLAVRAEDGTVVVVARGDFDRGALADSLFEEDSEQIFILVPFALLGLVLIWFVSGWSLRPLARASEEAAMVGPVRPGMRISVNGLPREVRPLVDAVNGALDRLARAYETERRLTADAAHELRTPLAVLNLRLQRARASGRIDWKEIDRELSNMGRMIAQLMDLARKEALSGQERVDDLPVVNLSRIVREAAAMVVPLAEAEGRHLELDLPRTASVRGRAEDLCDAIRNLLENALVHGRGTVAITIRRVVAPADSRLIVEVCDEGEGVPAGEERSVFARFRKLEADSPGSGLGLAIVQQVAISHGGQVEFVAGRGCVTLILPAATADRDAAVTKPLAVAAAPARENSATRAYGA
jgi:signal transduction histidine kinase